MQHRHPAHRKPGSTLRVLLAVLVLVGQLLAPTTHAAPRAPAAAALLLGQIPICHSGSGETSSEPGLPGPGQHPAGHEHCALCPLAHQPVPAAMPAATAPAIEAPGFAIIAQPSLPPPATGPPGQVRCTARPRGPPALSI
jgi:hypothetical protein